MSAPADLARAGPEVVLAAASLAAALSLAPRVGRPAGAALVLALGLLALDAGAGAGQYAGLGGRGLAQAHAALTAGFGSLGFALALGATVLAALRTPGVAVRWGVLAAVVVAGVVLARFAPLAPLVGLAHLIAAGVRQPRGRRIGFILSALLLFAVVASQLLLAAGVVRLGALHLLLAGWTAALAFAGRQADAPGEPAA